MIHTNVLYQCGPRLRAWRAALRFEKVSRAALRFEKASRAAKIKSRSGWSKFSTLVGHIFEKLFEFARLNRIKTLIFVSKSGCSLKKKGLHLESVCKIPIFVPKSGCSLKKKKKVFTWNRSAKFLFSRKIIAFSKKNYGCLSSTRLVQNCSAGQGLDHTVLYSIKKIFYNTCS